MVIIVSGKVNVKFLQIQAMSSLTRTFRILINRLWYLLASWLMKQVIRGQFAQLDFLVTGSLKNKNPHSSHMLLSPLISFMHVQSHTCSYSQRHAGGARITMLCLTNTIRTTP